MADTTGAPRRSTLVLAVLASAYTLVVWVPGLVGAYGYFIDEFYYLACASHLAAGYVDHPPLSVFILWLIRAVAGDSLPVLRVVPAVAGGLTVWLVGLLARRLGAGAWGQAMAAGAVMIGLVGQVTFSYYSMNAFSMVLWAAGFLVLVEIERRADPRWWLVFGLIVGVGFQNKHTFLLLPLGLGAGVVLTSARRHLAGPWLWLGGAAAAIVAAPNLWWQVANGWPSLEFYRNADFYKNVPTPPWQVLLFQVLATNPGTLPIWLGGLWFLLGTGAGRPYRHLAWAYVVLLVLMLIGQKSRPDRIAEAYFILFAAGGAWLDGVRRRAGLRWLRWAVPLVLLVNGAALAPLGLPLLPPARAASYAVALGVVPQIERGEGKRNELPQWLADRLGWEQLVDDVAAVAGTLSGDERARAVIVAPTYGQAGAIARLGRGRGLPPVHAWQNSYWHWGPPPESADVAILIGPFDPDTMRHVFAGVTAARVHDCDGCTRWRDEVPIWVVRHPRDPWREFWPLLRHYE